MFCRGRQTPESVGHPHVRPERADTRRSMEVRTGILKPSRHLRSFCESHFATDFPEARTTDPCPCGVDGREPQRQGNPLTAIKAASPTWPFPPSTTSPKLSCCRLSSCGVWATWPSFRVAEDPHESGLTFDANGTMNTAKNTRLRTSAPSTKSVAGTGILFEQSVCVS